MTSSPSAADNAAAARAALTVALLATLGRLAVAWWLPAGVDEAYTIGIARQLSLSYFDHPPLHIWLVGLWAKAAGTEAVFVLRLPFIVLGALSSALMWVFARRLFGAMAAAWAVALLSLAPVFGVAHATFVLPDGPLICAALGLAVAVRPLGTGEPMPLRRWAVAGLCAGLALLSKYHGVLLVGGVFVVLLGQPRRLLTAGPWVAAGLALALFTPVLVWNAQHGWVSFGFQAGRGVGGGLRPLGPLESLGQQAVYLLPWIMVPAGWAVIRAVWRGPARQETWLPAMLALPPIFVFTAATLLSRGLPHWPMPGWLFALPLFAERLAAWSQMARQRWRIGLAASGMLVWAFVGLVLVQVQSGVLTPAFGGRDPTDVLVSWESGAPALEARVAAVGNAVVAATDWIAAGELNYALGGHVPVACLCDDPRHFQFLDAGILSPGQAVLLVTRTDDGDADAVTERFDSMGPPEALPVMKQGHVAVPLVMRAGKGFRPVE